MAQTRADEDADEAIEEERVELLGRNLLLAVEAIDNEIGQRQSQTPHQRIPTYLDWAKRQGYLRGRPNNHDKRGLLSETKPKPAQLNIKAEVHDVAILHDVFLALHVEKARVAHGGLAA